MLKIPAVLALGDARASLAGLMATLQELPPGEVVADASALTRFDSSALAVLLACRRASLEKGMAFSVHGSSGRLRRLAGLYGVGELLHWAD